MSDLRYVARRFGRRGGYTLLTISFVLTIVSVLAVNGLRNSEREATTGARSRASARGLAAADAALQLAMNRLSQSPPNLNALDIALADGVDVQSRTRDQTSAQDLLQHSLGTSKEGFDASVGSGVGSVTRIYVVTTTATSGGSTVELEAKLGRTAVESVGY